MSDEDLVTRVQTALANAGMSMKAASIAAGLNDTFVRDLIRRGRTPGTANLNALAKALGVQTSWLLGEDGSETSSAELPRTSVVPGSALVSTMRMPVFAAAQGGDGHIIVSFEQIDEIKRPAELENVRGGYGLLIKGTSMEPAINEGDMALVNPHLPPARGKNVILYHTPPDGGEVEAIVKQLVSWNDREWSLKQWNPASEFKEFRQEWPICHRLVGTYYGR